MGPARPAAVRRFAIPNGIKRLKCRQALTPKVVILPFGVLASVAAHSTDSPRIRRHMLLPTPCSASSSVWFPRRGRCRHSSRKFPPARATTPSAPRRARRVSACTVRRFRPSVPTGRRSRTTRSSRRAIQRRPRRFRVSRFCSSHLRSTASAMPTYFDSCWCTIEVLERPSRFHLERIACILAIPAHRASHHRFRSKRHLRPGSSDFR